ETVLTRFQFASTAFTVTLKLVNALSAIGVPVFPDVVPGAAVSPGTSNCNFAKLPTPTLTLPLVLAVKVPAASVAVIVRVPTVLKVNVESVRVPEARVMLPDVAPLSSAIPALESELVTTTLGVALLTTFQLASTALTTTPP